MIGNNYINDLTFRLKKTLNLNPEQERAARKEIEKDWKNQVGDKWHTDDVKDRAARIHEIELTDDEALEILEACDRGATAETGINWDVIDVYIEQR